MVNLPFAARIANRLLTALVCTTITFALLHLTLSNYIDRQLASHASDSAHMVSAAIKPYIVNNQWQTANTQVLAFIQNGYYESIKVFDLAGNERIAQRIEIEHQSWFMQSLHFLHPDTPSARVDIINGWNPIASVQVSSSTRDALIALEMIAGISLLIGMAFSSLYSRNGYPLDNNETLTELLKQAKNGQALSIYHANDYRAIKYTQGKAIADTYKQGISQQLRRFGQCAQPFEDDIVLLTNKDTPIPSITGCSSASIGIEKDRSSQHNLQRLERALYDNVSDSMRSNWLKRAGLSLWEQAVVDGDNNTIYSELYARLTSYRGTPLEMGELIDDTESMRVIDRFVIDRALLITEHRNSPVAINLSGISLTELSNTTITRIGNAKILVEAHISDLANTDETILAKLTTNGIRLIAQSVTTNNLDQLINIGSYISQIKIRQTDFMPMPDNALSHIEKLGIPITVYQLADRRLIDTGGKFSAVQRQGNAIRQTKPVKMS